MEKEPNSDFTKILTRDHENKWVALSADRYTVLGYSADLVELKNKVKNKEVIYMKVQPRDVSFAF